MDSLPPPIASFTATTDDTSAFPEPAAPRTRSKLARAIVVLAIGAVVAYAVARYLDRSESVPPADDAADVVPVLEDTAGEAVDEDDGDRTSDDRSDQEHTREEDDDLERGTSVEVTEDDRSPEEIVERAREDVPEPGEMAVDDEVAEELFEEAEEVVEGDEDEGDVGDDGGADGGNDSSVVTDDERPD